MACVNAKGELTESAKKLLLAIENDTLLPEKIAERTHLPLFKVRSSLRDMKSMGFVNDTNGSYQISQDAKRLLDKQR